MNAPTKSIRESQFLLVLVSVELDQLFMSVRLKDEDQKLTRSGHPSNSQALNLGSQVHNNSDKGARRLR